MTRVTIRQIALEAGVSRPTANRILLGDTAAFRPTTTKLVLETAQRLNYRPNLNARGLKQNRSYLVGVMLPHYTSGHFAELTESAGQVILDAGWMPIAFVSPDKERGRALLDRLLDRRIDGLIIDPETTPDGQVVHEAALANLHRNTIPVVQVVAAPLEYLPSITPDWTASGYGVTRRLLELGHERIVYWGDAITIVGNHRDPSYRERFGYEQAMTEAGREPLVTMLPTDFDHNRTAFAGQIDRRSSLYTSAGRLMQQFAPDAVVCFSSNAANHLSQHLLDHPELRPPRFALSHQWRSIFTPGLPETRVLSRPGIQQMGVQAARMIFDLLESRPVESQSIPPIISVHQPASPAV